MTTGAGAGEQLLVNGLVVDGTGAAPQRADVLVRGATIVEVGEPGELAGAGADGGAVTIDLDGMVLAPGFIDIHTHYDAQIMWDPDLTPSSWHGVTTVVMGNCGIGIAPTRPADREMITRSLVNVEGMAEDALRAGIDWCFESFPDYVQALRDRHPRLNVELLLSHSPLRVFVMGVDAFEREANEGELGAMAALATEAVEAGALGFATSRSANHLADDGRPLPSRLAAVDELVHIGKAMTAARGNRAVIELAVGTGMSVTELGELAERTGATVTWTAVLAGRTVRGRTSAQQVQDCVRASEHLWPQVTCQPVRIQFTLDNPPSAFSKYPIFAEVLSAPAAGRVDAYRSNGWVARAQAEIGQEWDPLWSRTYLVVPGDDGTEVWGPTVTELAAERGLSPLAALVEVSAEQDLQARFDVIITNDDPEDLGDLLANERTLLGLSDAGAHASQLCDAGFATHLLGHWWRETGRLSLEQAVWRLTGQPASIFGLSDRGQIRPGAAADLVAFDPTTVGSSPLRRIHDLPSGADRLVCEGIGIQHVWVGGTLIRKDGQEVGGPGVGRVAGR